MPCIARTEDEGAKDEKLVKCDCGGLIVRNYIEKQGFYGKIKVRKDMQIIRK